MLAILHLRRRYCAFLGTVAVPLPVALQKKVLHELTIKAGWGKPGEGHEIKVTPAGTGFLRTVSALIDRSFPAHPRELRYMRGEEKDEIGKKEYSEAYGDPYMRAKVEAR
ncbi:hypothetical protein BBP40_005153 [Aspergillus hancockii]|nr:hypothetical protein BBP40_005153 [Aspergillus hancockii]